LIAIFVSVTIIFVSFFQGVEESIILLQSPSTNASQSALRCRLRVLCRISPAGGLRLRQVQVCVGPRGDQWALEARSQPTSDHRPTALTDRLRAAGLHYTGRILNSRRRIYSIWLLQWRANVALRHCTSPCSRSSFLQP